VLGVVYMARPTCPLTVLISHRPTTLVRTHYLLVPGLSRPVSWKFIGPTQAYLLGCLTSIPGTRPGSIRPQVYHRSCAIVGPNSKEDPEIEQFSILLTRVEHAIYRILVVQYSGVQTNIALRRS